MPEHKTFTATRAAHLAAAHGPFSGVHSHPHATFQQGGHNMHDHAHSHDNDARHEHHPAVTADASWPAGSLSMTAAAVLDAEPTELATLLAAAYADIPEGGSLVAAAMTALGSPFGVEQTGEDEWTLIDHDGARESFTTYADAVGHLSSLAFVDSRPVLAETWRSEMAFEDAETPDGRYIAPGALAYRDCPLPLMLQTTTDVGHFGAVLAGTITKCGTTNGTALGSGEFDDSEAGNQMMQMLQARGRFGVSIDGMSPAVAEFECTERDDDGDCVDGRMRFNLLTIGGLCYSDDTEVLSEHGWVRFAELPRGERVATRNPKTGAFEWQEPTHYTNDEWSGPMIRFSGPRVDLLVTPNHRMLVRAAAGTPVERFMRADELAKKTAWWGIHNWGIPATSQWKRDDVASFRIERTPVPEGFCACGCGTMLPTRAENRPTCSVDDCEKTVTAQGLCPAHYHRLRRHGDPLAGGAYGGTNGDVNRRLTAPMVTLPGHGHGFSTEPFIINGDTFAAFMGAWLAEGSLNVKSRQICIAQIPTGRGFEPYREMLTALLGRDPRHTGKDFVIRNMRLMEYLQQFGHAADKFVPTELKNFSARQLRIFFDHYMLGDGDRTGRRASTVSARLADDLQEVAQKIGLWAKIKRMENTIDRAAPGGRTILAENCQDTYRLDFYNRPDASKTAETVWRWDVEEVEYEGMVRCVTVPNESLYVRRDGKALWCGNTATPFPAFPDAYIALENRAVSASGAAEDEPCEECDEDAARFAAGSTRVMVGKEDPAPVGKEDPQAFTAAGGPVLPPADWFTDPHFEPGDGRMVRQPDGQWLCPLTITADGQVFGHMFGAKSCHTGILDRCQLPPRSPSNYAYFNRRPIPTADGDVVHVGILSMGCGHADLNLDWETAQAHYDGGPGAVQMADVHVGQDAYGAWFAGALRPGVSDEQVRAFTACSVSGDWREVQRGRGLDLVACLSGVTSPGFVITSMAAAGFIPDPSGIAGQLPAEAGARFVDGRAVSLVAAGVVRQPLPWERPLAALTAEIAGLRERLDAAERVTRPLQADAVGRILDGVVTATVPAANGH